MANEKLNVRIKLRNDSNENWLTYDPVLEKAELGVNDDNGKMKLGDGVKKWSELPYISNENDAAPFTHYEGESIDAAVGSNTPVEGDICVVKKIIADDKYSYTSYVYDEDSWKAMDGNYSAENVYFPSDLVITAPVGVYTQDVINKNNGSVVHATEGKNMIDGLSSLFAEVKNPTIVQPSVSLSSSATPSSAEIGTKITKLNWSGSFSGGSYEYGSKIGDTKYTDKGTGITSATWSISNTVDEQTSTAQAGSFTLTEPITIDTEGSKTYGKINWKGTYADSPRTPVNNVGTEYAAGKIAGKEVSGVANVNATGYRNSFYYVGTDCTTAIDSAFVRGTTARNANTKNFNVNSYQGTACLTIPAGTKRIMFAVPGSATLSTVTDIDGMGLDVKGNFTKSTVDVKGANDFTAASYTIFECVNESGLAATHYAISIS